MIVLEFQPQSMYMFQDELFVVEPKANLEQIDDHDDSGGVVMQSSSTRHP